MTRRACSRAIRNIFSAPSMPRKFGAHPQLLVKLLDPSIRLHFQAHPRPTSPAVSWRAQRQDRGLSHSRHAPRNRGALYLPGFPASALARRPPPHDRNPGHRRARSLLPTRSRSSRVTPTWCPAAVPHALRRKACCSSRCRSRAISSCASSSTRGGYVLPEPARFMGRGLGFCLDVFDYRRVARQPPRGRGRLPAAPPPRPRPGLLPGQPHRAGAHAVLLGPRFPPARAGDQDRGLGLHRHCHRRRLRR